MHRETLFVFFLGLGLSQSALAQVGLAVPDGFSDTTITYDDAGRALVDIAAPLTLLL